jgi:hypothetical protein
MDAFLILACAVMAVVYIRRVNELLYGQNDWSFVFQQSMTAVSCIIAGLDCHLHGWSAIAFMAPITAGLYLLRSHDTFKFETTKPCGLDEIDMRDLTNVYGRGEK